MSGGERDGALAFLKSLEQRRPLLSATAEDVEGALHLLADRWLECDYDPPRAYAWLCTQLELDAAVLHAPTTVDMKFSREVAVLAELFKSMEQSIHPDDPIPSECMLSTRTSEGEERRHKMCRIAEVLHFARVWMNNCSAMQSVARRETYDSMSWEEHAQTLLSDNDQKPHQVVLLYVLNLLAQPHLRYRKYGDGCYSEIISKDGHFTQAWQRESTILDFIYQHVTKETHYPMWDKLTSSHLGMAGLLAEHIEKSQQVQFPALEYQRHLLSFRNGIYNVRQLSSTPTPSARLGRRSSRTRRTAWRSISRSSRPDRPWSRTCR
jgi:hypothetical protein